MSRTNVQMSTYIYKKQDIYFSKNCISLSSEPSKTQIYIHIYMYTDIYETRK